MLLIGLDTDTDAIRVHPPSQDSEMVLDRWLCARELHAATASMTADQAMAQIAEAIGANPGQWTRDGVVSHPVDRKQRFTD